MMVLTLFPFGPAAGVEITLALGPHLDALG